LSVLNGRDGRKFDVRKLTIELDLLERKSVPPGEDGGSDKGEGDCDDAAFHDACL
jgi:hypothetical protein